MLAEVTDAVGTSQFQDLLNSSYGPYIVTYGLGAAKVIAILFATWLVAGFASRMCVKALRKARLDETLTKFSAKMLRWSILLMGFLACLSIFGFETTSFAAVIGAGGLAVGLAFQGTLSNFACGVMLLIFRPFKVDQVVSVAGVTGKVFEIDLFSTILDTPDNRRLILPNSSVFGANIENIGHHTTRRVDVEVGCCYSADIDFTRQVLTIAAANVPGILEEPGPAVVLTGLGASSVDWSIRVWADSADYWDVKQALLRAVKICLDQSNIGIPYPQMDVHINSSELKKMVA